MVQKCLILVIITNTASFDVLLPPGVGHCMLATTCWPLMVRQQSTAVSLRPHSCWLAPVSWSGWRFCQPSWPGGPVLDTTLVSTSFWTQVRATSTECIGLMLQHCHVSIENYVLIDLLSIHLVLAFYCLMHLCLQLRFRGQAMHTPGTPVLTLPTVTQALPPTRPGPHPTTTALTAWTTASVSLPVSIQGLHSSLAKRYFERPSLQRTVPHLPINQIGQSGRVGTGATDS